MANDYSQKLRNPLWQAKRLLTFNRDEFTCTLCGDCKTELHVHHKYYKPNTEPWDYPDDAFQTLDKHCHLVVEHLKPYKVDITKAEFRKYPFDGFQVIFFIRYNDVTFVAIIGKNDKMNFFQDFKQKEVAHLAELMEKSYRKINA
jgi:hypothetical protein